MSVADYIDNSPMGKLFDFIVKEGPVSAICKGAKALGDVAVSITDSVTAGISAITPNISEIASSMSGPSKNETVAVAKVREPEIAAPSQSNHVDMAELGNFSPPSFGNSGASQSVGRG